MTGIRNVVASCLAILAVASVALNFTAIAQSRRNKLRGIAHRPSTTPLVTWSLAGLAGACSAFGSWEGTFLLSLWFVAIVDPSFWTILWTYFFHRRS